MSDKYDIMSDMASNRLTVRVPQNLNTRLRSRSRTEGTTESELIREALERYLARDTTERSAYDLAEDTGVIGAARQSPKDLSTNRLHFKGFGESKSK